MGLGFRVKAPSKYTTDPNLETPNFEKPRVEPRSPSKGSLGEEDHMGLGLGFQGLGSR